MSRIATAAVAGLVLIAGVARSARGDQFDRLEGDALSALVKSTDATARSSLTSAEIESLPGVLRDASAALLIATTGQGNVARLLVSPALRKPPGGKGDPVPVLVLERFDTFEAGNLATRLARGKDLILFAGFQLDLDSGQVVPDGQGGDLKLEPATRASARLVPVEGCKLFTLSRPPALPAASSTRPSLGRGVVAADYNGRFRLFANGQWSGVLELKVDAAGAVTGRFRSDLNGTSYPVHGQVAADVPQKVAFTVTLPRTRQDYEGLLWTEGKGAMAGTMTMLDRAYGFFAVRDGGRFGPDGDDAGPLLAAADRPGRRTVTIKKGQYALDGKPQTDRELTDALKRAVAADPATWVLLRVPGDEPFAAVNAAFEVVGAAGVASIRLAPADTEP